MLEFCQWLDQTAVGSTIRQSLWLFPAIQTVHLLGMAALVGTITVLDLRLLGWAMPQRRVSEVTARLLPWAWLGFGVQVVTGVLLFSSEAVKIYGNPAFRLKMLLLLLAGIQALLFQTVVSRKLPTWDDRPALPVMAKVMGMISILLWLAIVTAGRFIGFV
ncbi:MAG TPA: DUF6644 family protein [Candidatus Sulfotelmatobacter sp.]|nr:DUF6644 family protein [Candidatus Sulfotelmatobacter sp.]